MHTELLMESSPLTLVHTSEGKQVSLCIFPIFETHTILTPMILGHKHAFLCKNFQLYIS